MRRTEEKRGREAPGAEASKKKQKADNEAIAPTSRLAMELRDVCSLLPEKISVADVIRLASKNVSKLTLLETASLVSKASFGLSPQQISNLLNSQDPEMQGPMDKNLLMFEFARAKGVSMGYDEELDSALMKLQDTLDDPCERGFKTASADEKTELVVPFLMREPEEVSVLELCHVIEFLVEHGLTDCTNSKDLAKYHACEDWFDSWLDLHPNVDKYLDPVMLYFSPAIAAPPAALTAALGGLPIGPALVSAAPARISVVGLPNGSAHIFGAANAQDARSISVAMRTHFANPVAGAPGGAGAAMVIGRFATRGFGGLTFA